MYQLEKYGWWLQKHFHRQDTFLQGKEYWRYKRNWPQNFLTCMKYYAILISRGQQSLGSGCALPWGYLYNFRLSQGGTSPKCVPERLWKVKGRSLGLCSSSCAWKNNWESKLGLQIWFQLTKTTNPAWVQKKSATSSSQIISLLYLCMVEVIVFQG